MVEVGSYWSRTEIFFVLLIGLCFHISARQTYKVSSVSISYSVAIKMHFKVVVKLSSVILLASALASEYEDPQDSRYVMVGTSQERVREKMASKKNTRNSFEKTYPFHHHQFGDFGHGFGFNGLMPQNHEPTSLVSANINLLEPFMLVTFLLFVLSLIDRVRIPSFLPRRDRLTATGQELGNAQTSNSFVPHIQLQ
jgi:hypothetical protein